ncbi:MAG: nitroreductase family protein, partial [Elusimicrobiota bacterium]|nr:nitroreductase family protein [Elusimicrobiota bacterium]
MKRNILIYCFALLFVLSCFVGNSFAQNSQANAISLPAPQKTGGKPLMETLSLRKGERNMSNKALSLQQLSGLLWSAWGINRPDGRRTVPTAMNKQDINVYVVLENGVWLYDAAKNQLIQILAQDVRSKFSPAGATLLFAVPSNDKFAKMHVGSLYQNAALYCASEGLANIVKANGADALKGVLSLPSNYEIVIIQAVGY